MNLGTVKWFDDDKGYGFIKGDDGEEYFVHRTRLYMKNRGTLETGQRVGFDIEESEKGKMAIEVKTE